jgi:hypothetical protein
MSEQAAIRNRAGIDIPKTIASVLATVTAAVVGSFAGVAGTLIGAALASLIGSIGTELYQRSIRKGAEKLQASFVTAAAAVGTPPVAADQEVAEDRLPAPKKIRWARVAAVAGVVFVLALGTLTIAELISGRSAADAVSGGSGSSPSICSVLCRSGGSGHRTEPTPADTSASPTPSAGTDTGSASAEPSATSTGSAQPSTSGEPASTATATPTATADDPGANDPAGNGSNDSTGNGSAGNGSAVDDPAGSGSAGNGSAGNDSAGEGAGVEPAPAAKTENPTQGAN